MLSHSPIPAISWVNPSMCRIFRSVSTILPDVSTQSTIFLCSSPFYPVADSFPFGILDDFLWHSPLGNITLGWYDGYLRDMLRDSIQQYSELTIFIFLFSKASSRHHDVIPMFPSHLHVVPFAVD